MRSEMRSCLLLTLSCVCIFFVAGVACSQGLVIMAKKVGGELPLDPDHAVWSRAVPVEVPLAPQVFVKPRVYESAVKSLKVRALHNTGEIAFLVEWKDATEDASTGMNRFTDGMALEFPASGAMSKPHFAMGDKENPVNIWFWKPARQKPDATKKDYTETDDFLGGVQAGNPLSLPGDSPVENIVAQGFGSTTGMERTAQQSLRGYGRWRSETWTVVLKRSLTVPGKLEAGFKEGKIIPVAFALWNGSEEQRGGRKTVSTWYYVGLETEEKMTPYLFAFLAFAVTAGLEVGVLLGIRRRNK